MSRILIFDAAGDLQGEIAEAAALELAAARLGYVHRDGRGRVRRFIAHPVEKLPPTDINQGLARLHAASRTTRPVTGQRGQYLGDPRLFREFN